MIPAKITLMKGREKRGEGRGKNVREGRGLT